MKTPYAYAFDYSVTRNSATISVLKSPMSAAWDIAFFKR